MQRQKGNGVFAAVAPLAAVGVAVALVLNAFNSNLVFFYTPTQIATKEAPQGRRRRATRYAAAPTARIPRTPAIS